MRITNGRNLLVVVYGETSCADVTGALSVLANSVSHGYWYKHVQNVTLAIKHYTQKDLEETTHPAWAKFADEIALGGTPVLAVFTNNEDGEWEHSEPLAVANWRRGVGSVEELVNDALDELSQR